MSPTLRALRRGACRPLSPAVWMAACCLLTWGCVTPSGSGGYFFDAGASDLGGADGAPADVWLDPADGSDAAADVGTTDLGPADGGGSQDGAGDLGAPPDTTTGPTTCSATVGPAGGQLACGAVLDVPAGALAAETILTLTDTQAPAPTGFQGYSTVWRVDPPGLAFSKPATLAVPFQGGGSLASAFWRADGAKVWTWLGGAVQGGKLHTALSGGGEVFIANGIAYAQPADKSCAVLRKIEGRTQKPSNIAVFFTVDDCDGNPITDLQDGDFVLEEDGKPLSVESPAKVLPQKGLQVFLTLALDFSGSTDPMQDKVIAAAKALVQQIQVEQKLPAQIGLEVFDGAQTSTVWQKHTLDTQKLLGRLDQLQGYKAKSSGTNLYGAVVDGLARLDAAQQVFRAMNQGGAFTTGYLVVFTDGADTTGYLKAGDALGAEANSADQVLAVGLQTLDYDKPALEQLAPFGLLTAPDPTQLGVAFQAIGTRIAGQVSRTYLVAYCSVKKKDAHVLSIRLAGATQNVPVQYTFDATGFGDGCTIESFETACAGKACAGLGCGACDDRLGVCSGGMCKSFCDGWTVAVQSGSPPAVTVWQTAAQYCGLQPFANPQGYEQTCADAPKRTWCAGACVDTTTANFNAAGCGQCASAFSGPKCDQCADPQHFALPDCKTTCANAFTGPGCSQCKDPHFALPDCKTTCAPEFTGPGCQLCANPQYAWPGCKTTCAKAFTGPGCGQCADPVHFALPDCTTTCAKAFAGPGCSKCADPGFALPDCTTSCSEAFAGPGCKQCYQPQFAAPDCTWTCAAGVGGTTKCSKCVDPQKGMPDCLCAPQETAIPLTSATASQLVCAPDFPSWGIRPLSPEALLSDKGDGTVLDAGTTLTWQKSTSASLDWYAASAYCDGLVLGGHDDWRLPTARELETVVDFAKSGSPAVPKQLDLPPGEFLWTASRKGSLWSEVRILRPSTGAFHTTYSTKTTGYIGARCVRGLYASPAPIPPAERFVIVSDLWDPKADTVQDQITGLSWQRSAFGGTGSWAGAKSACDGLTLGGKTDWRLPDVVELRSLVDDKGTYPYPTEFPNPANYYWSATPGNDASKVRVVASGPYTLVERSPADTKTSSFRCVR